MRLLWCSNAPWANTGYGGQTAQVVPRLAADSHEVAIAANFGLEAAPSSWRGVPVMAKGYGAHSEDILPAHLAAWLDGRPGWAITLYDVWPLLGIPNHDALPFASWTPVDRYPVPPQVAEWSRRHYTIAMSLFGQRALTEVGVQAQYVPHAIDTATFAPTPSAFREALGIPDDAFLVTINAANKGGTPVRKAWSEMLSAFALFAKNRPDAYLYLHTHLDGIMNAPRLAPLLGALGLTQDRVKVVDQYAYLAGRISDGILAGIYSASDVLLATSMGEGFGIPVIEAQACGTPVIVTDFTAQPELVGAGWTVGYQPWWDHYQASWAATPLVRKVADALEAAYAARGDAALRAQARTFALQYDADTVYDQYWRPVLADLADRLVPRPPRRERRAKGKRR